MVVISSTGQVRQGERSPLASSPTTHISSQCRGRRSEYCAFNELDERISCHFDMTLKLQTTSVTDAFKEVFGSSHTHRKNLVFRGDSSVTDSDKMDQGCEGDGGASKMNLWEGGKAKSCN
uniref:Predicted protein n=1 Tax=Physcomitrium patens TaxID=3218 RepID=A9TZM9_PHYPA